MSCFESRHQWDRESVHSSEVSFYGVVLIWARFPYKGGFLISGCSLFHIKLVSGSHLVEEIEVLPITSFRIIVVL